MQISRRNFLKKSGSGLLIAATTALGATTFLKSSQAHADSDLIGMGYGSFSASSSLGYDYSPQFANRWTIPAQSNQSQNMWVSAMNSDVYTGTGLHPEWIEVNLGCQRAVTAVGVMSLRDDLSGGTPTRTETGSSYVIKDFQVKGWDGYEWHTVATVINNNLIWRVCDFVNPINTDRIRIYVSKAAGPYVYMPGFQVVGNTLGQGCYTSTGYSTVSYQGDSSSGYYNLTGYGIVYADQATAYQAWLEASTHWNNIPFANAAIRPKFAIVPAINPTSFSTKKVHIQEIQYAWVGGSVYSGGAYDGGFGFGVSTNDTSSYSWSDTMSSAIAAAPNAIAPADPELSAMMMSAFSTIPTAIILTSIALVPPVDVAAAAIGSAYSVLSAGYGYYQTGLPAGGLSRFTSDVGTWVSGKLPAFRLRTSTPFTQDPN